MAGQGEAPAFRKPEKQKVAQIAYEVIKQYENQPQSLPTVEHLKMPEIQVAIVRLSRSNARPDKWNLKA